jgi:hypothetical protein
VACFSVLQAEEVQAVAGDEGLVKVEAGGGAVDGAACGEPVVDYGCCFCFARRRNRGGS